MAFVNVTIVLVSLTGFVVSVFVSPFKSYQEVLRGERVVV
jgi:hypothetical protein